MNAGRLLADRWLLVEKIGVGNWGDVWRALDPEGKPVAVKFLRAWQQPTDVDAFRREIHLLEILDLPGVVKIRGSGRDGDQPFLVMDLAEGIPFPGRPVSGEGLPWSELAPLLSDLLNVLDSVHRMGVVHRDLSPANVLVREDGRVLVLDFGLAVRRHHDRNHQRAAGTLPWMSPEQLQGAAAEEGSDLYAVGLLAWYGLTGQILHDGYSWKELVSARVRRPTDEAARLHTATPEVRAWIGRLLNRDSRRRFSSAAAAARAMPGSPAIVWSPGWLGDPDLITRIADHATTRCVRISAARGAGSTRLLDEVANVLHRAGHDVARGEPSGETAADRVWLCDRDTSRDPPRGVRIVAPGEAADEPLAPLTQPQLQAIFRGWERILAIPSTAAALVHELTLGHAALVIDLLRSWIEGGHAHVEQGGLRLRHAALQFLKAHSLPPHRRPWRADAPPHLARPLALLDLGRALLHTTDIQAILGADAPGLRADLVSSGLVAHDADGRHLILVTPPERLDTQELRALHLRLLLSRPAGDPGRWPHAWALPPELACAEACAQARRLIDAADPVGALDVIETFVEHAHHADPEGMVGLSALLLEAALDQPRADTFGRARTIAQSAGMWEVAELCDVVRRVLTCDHGAWRELPDPSTARPELGTLVARLWNVAASSDDRAAAQTAIRRLQVWSGDDPIRQGWLLRVCAAQNDLNGDFGRAAAGYEAAAERMPREQQRCHMLYLAATSWSHLGDHRAAWSCLDASWTLAKKIGYTFVLGRGAALARQLTWFSGGVRELDPELIELLAEAAGPHVQGYAAVTEAAIAWSLGDARAIPLARLARTNCEHSWPTVAMMASALLVRLGDSLDHEELIRVALGPRIPPGLAVQVLGLVGARRSLARPLLKGMDLTRSREIITLERALTLMIPDDEEH